MSRNTIPVITKYEMTYIIAERAAELANGEPSTIAKPGTNNPKEIAILEFNAKKIPNRIIRNWTNGDQEVWNLNELQIYQTF